MEAPIQRALRNAATLRWWADCDEGFRVAARALYGQAYGMPLCELCTLAEFAQDEDAIEWLAHRFPNAIEAHMEDNL